MRRNSWAQNNECMIDFFDNIDNDLNDGGTRVVPIITEIREVVDETDIKDSNCVGG